MLNLIILLVVSSIIAYISKANLMPVDLSLGQYTFPDIPLFYVIIGSLLTGLVLSYILQLFRNFAKAMEMRGKKREIRSGKEEVVELTKRIHQLELENEKLKHSKAEPDDADAI